MDKSFLLDAGCRDKTKEATPDRMMFQKLTYGCKIVRKSMVFSKREHMLIDVSPESVFGVKLSVKGESKMDLFWFPK